MELRVEAALGFTLPKNCFIGVRVGDVLKQGRYEPQRCFNFPQLDRRRNAKVDIYQHVGTCMVAVDPDTKATHEVAVTSLDPETPASRIKIHVQAMSEENKQQREQRTKALKVQARDYLMKYSIEERLSEAVKALLKEQPADPTAFLCKQLTDWDKASAVTKEAAPAASELPQVFEDESVNRLRKDAREAFVRATDDGSLESALNSVKGGRNAHGKDGGSKDSAGKEDVRLRVSNLLVDSAENGDLERALASVMKEGLGKMSKEQYMEKIKQDAAGQNQKPEFYAEGDESEIIRLEAQNLLIGAMKNGTLEGILNTVLKDGKANAGGQGALQKTISGHLCSVPPEQTQSATQRVVKDLSAADQSKIRTAIQKIEADPKDALRIKVAELMLSAPDKNLDSTVANVIKDLSKADKEKIAQAIEKLEAVREAKAERAELRDTVKDLLRSSPEAVLPRHASQVMQGLSPEDRKKIQDAIQLAEASNAKTATGGATSSSGSSTGQMSKGEELMMAAPENHKHQQCSIEAAVQGMGVDDRKKIRDSVQHLEASSPEDALRIKATELNMATPSNPKDQLAAITEAMKGLKATDKKKIADAIQHLEASSENDAARIKAAEMMMLAPSNPKHQHFAIAAAMKGISADERKKIQDELQNTQASGDKEALQQKVVDLMATPPVRRHQHFAIAAAMKDLGPAERTKVFQSVAKAEATSQASSKKQDGLAAMAADLLLTAAEEGKFENKLAEAIEDRKEEQEALPLRERLTELLERAKGKDLRKELPAIMKDLSDAEQKKIIVAVRKVQGDPHHALRVKTAELMLSAPEGAPLEQSVAATIKELSAAEKSKLKEAVEKVENSAPKLAHTLFDLLKSTPEDQMADAIKAVIKDLSASDRSQVQQAMAQVEADPHDKLRLTMAELMGRSAGATQGAAVAASLQELPAADRQKISEAVSHVEAFHSPVIFQNEMMNTSMNSFGMQPGLAIM